MAQRRMWHFVERRLRDGREGESKEKNHVVRECKAMVEEDHWSGFNQVKKGRCSKPTTEIGGNLQSGCRGTVGRYVEVRRRRKQ